MPHRDRLQAAASILLAVLLLGGCNIRYISPDDMYAAEAEPEAESQAGAADGAGGGNKPWYAFFVPGEWDAGSTEPHHPIGPVVPAQTITPPQATAAPHVETAAQVEARHDLIDPDDPLRSEQHRWVMEQGITLEDGLRGWTDKVGLQLRWDVPRIYRIEAPIVINGTFEYAFSRVMEAYALADRPVLFDYGLYSNQVLRVTLRGELAP